jgi:hypothetical protein
VPLEIDASRRAIKFLKTEKVLDAGELKQAKKLLRAAALTYIGGVFKIIVDIFRFIFNIVFSIFK